MAKTISINRLDDNKAALATAVDGDEVKFNDGVHDRPDMVYLTGGVRYVGANRRKAIVKAADGRFAFGQRAGTSIELIDLTCDGSFLAPEGKCTWKVDGCEIFNFMRGPNVGYGAGMGIGLPSSSQPQNMSVTRTLFRGPGYCGIGFFRGDNWKITDCTFDGINVPIKSNNVGATDINGVIDRIRYRGVRGPIEEMQGCARNFRHTRTIATDFVTFANFNDGSYSIGHSIIYHGRNSDGNYTAFHIIRGDKAQGLPRIGAEVGDGYVVEGYDIDGGNVLVACYMGDSSGQVPADTIQPTAVRNNRVRNMRVGLGGLEGGQNPEKFSMDPATNNANVALHAMLADSATWGDPYSLGNSGGGSGGGGDVPPPLVAPISVFGKMQTGLNAMNGWGGVELNMSNGENAANDGKPLTINGEKFATGLGCHAPFAADYDLTDPHNEDYVPLSDRVRFTCKVGIDDETGGQGTVRFRVLADGKEVLMQPLKAKAAAVAISVDLPQGTKTVKLLGDDAGDGNAFDHFDIIDPKLVEITPTAPNPKVTVTSPANVDVVSVKGTPQAGKPTVTIASTGDVNVVLA